MPSTLTWIDHDAEARERSLRILALFQERESRDELGLGGVRDSFADRLFPGTSTIQTRLRYMLFVPWIYRNLERARVPTATFAQRADAAERSLIDAMRGMDDREAGIFGGRSGRDLKRLPSSVYWAGLGAWGIRLIDLSQDAYHRGIGRIYARRDAEARQEMERRRTGDDGDRSPDRGAATWHPRLPEAPKDFPAEASFRLTGEEAAFLLDRLKQCHPQSFLAHLALHCEPVDVAAPWMHPEWVSFLPEHRELLDHARLFSEALHGAALAYNLALAEARNKAEWIENHRARLREWLEALDYGALGAWPLPRLWALTLDQGHVITPATRRFVERWVQATLSLRGRLVDDDRVRELVRRREMALKKSRSRFTNRRALDQWRGASGLGRMTYRWSTARTFLQDLHDGLSRGEVESC